jgi:hypothetical protein
MSGLSTDAASMAKFVLGSFGSFAFPSSAKVQFDACAALTVRPNLPRQHSPV